MKTHCSTESSRRTNGHETGEYSFVSRKKKCFILGVASLVSLLVLSISPVVNAATKQWTVSDFPAHRVDLKKGQRERLDNIAQEVIYLRESNKPIVCLRILGHAATWRNINSLQYESRAAGRAHEAARYLSQKLDWKGVIHEIVREEDFDDRISCNTSEEVVFLIIGGRSDREPLVPNHTERTDRAARDNRAKNRRVEVSVRASDPVTVGCRRDAGNIRRLSEMLPTGTDGLRKLRVLRFKKLLLWHYKCERTIEDTYMVVDEPDQRSFITDFETNCEGKSKNALARCLNKIHDAMRDRLEHFKRELNYWEGVAQVGKDIKKFEECGEGRYRMKLAAVDSNVYSAFRRLVNELFEVCK